MLHPHTSLLLDQIMAKFFDTIRGDDDKETVALACTHSQKSFRILLCSIFLNFLFASFFALGRHIFSQVLYVVKSM
jgi:hypothetical protein